MAAAVPMAAAVLGALAQHNEPTGVLVVVVAIASVWRIHPADELDRPQLGDVADLLAQFQSLVLVVEVEEDPIVEQVIVIVDLRNFAVPADRVLEGEDVGHDMPPGPADPDQFAHGVPGALTVAEHLTAEHAVERVIDELGGGDG